MPYSPDDSEERHRCAVLCHHELVRKGARALLDEFYELEIFESADVLASTLGTYSPDVIVVCAVDHSRQRVIDKIGKLSEIASKTPVVLVVHSEILNHAIREFLDAGALAYVSTRYCTLDELRDIIRRARKGEITVDGRTASQMVAAQQNNSVLTAREIEVMNFVAEGLTNDQVADAMFVSSSTVASHLSSACVKLRANGSRAAAVSTAIRAGFI